jgi:predicted acetyltransferase
LKRECQRRSPPGSLRRYLDILDEREHGLNLPPDHVPVSLLFGFDGNRIVGRVSIRHRLNDVLRRAGGHIGYVVVPEFRRQGYATALLRLALRFAHDTIGLDRVLVTSDDDNVGSIRTIEHNGGVLEDVISGPDVGKPTRRYWIDARHA